MGGVGGGGAVGSSEVRWEMAVSDRHLWEWKVKDLIREMSTGNCSILGLLPVSVNAIVVYWFTFKICLQENIVRL